MLNLVSLLKDQLSVVTVFYRPHIVKGVLGQFKSHLWSPWCVSNQGLSTTSSYLHNLHGNPLHG